MRRISFFIVVLLLLTVLPAAQAQPLLSNIPAPCFVELPKIYLVIDGTRRHIVDWDTFLNLGYKPSDIVQCGENAKLPEGVPITRLIKGSSDAVYWMENGVRRHIPDMATFDALGFKLSNITKLPDAVVESWPQGSPLASRNGATGVIREISMGRYTIRLIKSGPYTTYATISALGQPEVKIADAASIGVLPATDITGDGAPDALFPTYLSSGGGGSQGTKVYSLGATPTLVMEVNSVFRWGPTTGQGQFKDLNGDGIYEFITHDPLLLPRCSSMVTVVLRYDGHRYVAANPQFQAFYNGLIAEFAANPTTQCEAIPTLLYLDRIDEAKAIFDRLYQGTETVAYWPALLKLVKQGRYYVPSH